MELALGLHGLSRERKLVIDPVSICAASVQELREKCGRHSAGKPVVRHGDMKGVSFMDVRIQMQIQMAHGAKLSVSTRAEQAYSSRQRMTREIGMIIVQKTKE